MSKTLTVDAGILRIVMPTTLTARGLHDIADALTELERSAAVTPHRLVDMSGITRFEVGFEEMFDLAERRRAHPPANPIRSAWVASTPVQVGFARMFQTLNDHPLVDVQIFPDVVSALAWLTED
ncbi:MAG TPA: hypothetical protein VJT67_17575 [Longimicrobiaceae bacterium]|nr:hypothetical protein [Longimicrobiaceae bacterium]